MKSHWSPLQTFCMHLLPVCGCDLEGLTASDCTVKVRNTPAPSGVSMFAAINEAEPEAAQLGLTGETVEAAESRVAASYEQALLLLQRQETDAAQVPSIRPLKAFEVSSNEASFEMRAGSNAYLKANKYRVSTKEPSCELQSFRRAVLRI